MKSSFLVQEETRSVYELEVFSDTSGTHKPQAVICNYSSCFALHIDEATNMLWDHNAKLLLPSYHSSNFYHIISHNFISFHICHMQI